MVSLGVPNNVPTRYVGPGINIIPTIQAAREPLVTDKAFQLQTIWRVSKNPTTGTEGDEWILVRFESNGDATWRRFDFTGSGPGIDEIMVDASTPPGTNPVLPDGTGLMTVTGAQVAAGAVGANVIRTDSLAANTYTIEVQRSTAVAASDADNNGVSHFDSSQFTVDANAFVSITNFSPFNYVQIDDTDSPYVATSTDYYISCDSSSGTIIVQLPDAPTQFRMFTIKDRVGSATTNNITITTVGGIVTIDGATSYLLASNFASINLLFNGTSYEIY